VGLDFVEAGRLALKIERSGVRYDDLVVSVSQDSFRVCIVGVTLIWFLRGAAVDATHVA
jgi:hypothetical protein